MELVFIRHAEPRWAVDGISHQDPVLTERGRRQADLVAARMAADTRPVSELIVSPAVRAQQTAAPIVTATGVEPETVDGLLEIQMPDWDGHPEETVQRIFAEARHRSSEEWWDGLPGGESFRDFHARVTEAMETLLRQRSVVLDPGGRPHLWTVEEDPGRVVIVGHGGTNAVALGWLLGVDPTPWEWERFVLGHASIARVRAVPLAGGHVFSLRSFNDLEHLPRGERTR